jgi:hypothetical protein
MSTIKADTLSNLAGTQTVPVSTVAQGSAKAWVNFNGTGTVAIRASFNVSSITDNGTGDYTVNFTTAMPDANYAATASGGQVGGGFGSAAIQMFVQNSGGSIADTAPTTSSFRFCTLNFSGSFADLIRINVSVFR